jgi:hypothetical protein
MIDIQSYTISTDGLSIDRIINPWLWLTNEDKTAIALTKCGDMLLKDPLGKLFFLDTGIGEMKLISENYLDFSNGTLGEEVYEELLMPKLIDELENANKKLAPGQVYAFYKLPLLGGTYEKDNVYPVNLYEHYSLTGEIHLQLKDLPDGSQVNFKITE